MHRTDRIAHSISEHRCGGRITRLAILLATMFTTQGCSYYGNALCSTVAPYEQEACGGLRETAAALKARSLWNKTNAACFAHHCSPKDVRAGYVAGFVDVYMGGNGCPPLFAPSGHCGLGLAERNTAAWFEGYPIGAAAAEACGAGGHRYSRANPALLAICQQPTCNPGCEPCTKNVSSCNTCGHSESACSCNSVPVEPPHVPSAGYALPIRIAPYPATEMIETETIE